MKSDGEVLPLILECVVSVQAFFLFLLHCFITLCVCDLVFFLFFCKTCNHNVYTKLAIIYSIEEKKTSAYIILEIALYPVLFLFHNQLTVNKIETKQEPMSDLSPFLSRSLWMAYTHNNNNRSENPFYSFLFAFSNEIVM